MLNLLQVLTLFLLILAGPLVVSTRGATSAEPGEGFVTTKGVRIWYRFECPAKDTDLVPLLMIHGGPGATARPFEKTIGPEIARTRPVVYMDYRGAGRSDRPADPAQYSFAILADDAEAIRTRLGIERWVVFGHSNGGATAITYALRYPTRTAALILCNPLLNAMDLQVNMLYKVASAPADQFPQARAVYKSSASDEERFGKLLNLIDPETRSRLQFFDPHNDEVLSRIQHELATEIGKDLMAPALIEGLIASGFFQFDAFRSAADLPMPGLLLLGRHDSETSVENGIKFALALPDGYIALFNRSGHHPYLEETSPVAQRIGTFLSSYADTVKSQRAN